MADRLTFTHLVNKYSRLGLVIDTGPLLVLIVGKHKPSELQHIKSAAKYNEKDYEVMLSFLDKFQRIVITPYIISELSNLIHKRLDRSHFQDMILECASRLKSFEEQQLEKDKVLNRKEAQWLGFTDVSIMIGSETQKLLVLTEDSGLLTECKKNMVDVINFDSLRANLVDF